jgi:hypothetical protein
MRTEPDADCAVGGVSFAFQVSGGEFNFVDSILLNPSIKPP